MEDHPLFQPLLSSTTASSTSTTTTTFSSSTLDVVNIEDDYIKVIFSSNSSITLRLVTIVSICFISLWANHEASKGFDITIINDIKDSPAGKRFTLLYMSNDKAIRIIQNTSSIVENILYPNITDTKKKVDHVTLRLVSTNQTNLVTVITNTNHEFVINVSPSSIMVETKNLDSEITSMVLQGMARIWVWDAKSMAPSWLVDGLVEYIKKVAGFAGTQTQVPELGQFCLGDKDPRNVAEFLDHCEKVKKGFIQRLNEGLKDEWHNFTVENALGMPASNLCGSFGNSSLTVF